MFVGSSPFVVTLILNMASICSKEFYNIQAIVECDIIKTHRQCTIQISTHNAAQSLG